ncbi:hypothetical protein [Proteiniphilum saccharofermentans]|uniref:hypothetical protein n=1 Tax=Proteiniphilum saccharofermentans TaxID=1642647 RepID=UPI00373FE3E0
MAKECIAVFDTSKFDKRSFCFIARVNDIDAIVTDSQSFISMNFKKCKAVFSLGKIIPTPYSIGVTSINK